MLGDNNNNFKDEVQPDMSLNLEEGEKIIYQSKPTKSAMRNAMISRGLPFVLLWSVFDAVMLFFIIKSFVSHANGADFSMLLFSIGFFAVHMTPVWMWLRNILTADKKYKKINYVLTDKRVIIKDATAKYKFRDVFLEDIKRVTESTKRNGIGCVMIYANTQVYVIPYLSNAAQFKEKIDEYVAAAHKNAEKEEEEQKEREEIFEGYTPLARDSKYDAPNSSPYPVQEAQSEEDKLKEQFEELFSDDED
ncbi:MAG: hypothetical protein K2I79_02450 [Clostridia bacterium]|nr:hypothetical protein [Clostridia bacterium]